MLIGIDARKLGDGGIGTYIRSLGAALLADPGPHDYAWFVEPAAAGRTPWPRPAREIVVRAGKYSLAEHWVLPRAAAAAGVDVLHAPHYTLPLGWRGPAVVTIHDLIHLRYPGFFPPGAAVYARVMAGLAAQRARCVIANSEYTKAEVVERLGVDPGRVRVIPLAVDAELTRAAPGAVDVFRRERGLPADYLLYVGARRRHKNLALLLEALAAIPAAHRPPLVLSGVRWPGDDPLARRAAELGIAGALAFAGDFADTHALACVYSGAALYVQPSLTEGFGLPPLEAMACGTPVLSSDGGALPETVGDAAALLPPHGPARWASEIEALLGDTARRAALMTRGAVRARAWSWARAAAATREAYDQAGSLPGAR